MLGTHFPICPSFSLRLGQDEAEDLGAYDKGGDMGSSLN